MSRLGSTRWWQETALITGAGLALAAWLWDGWPFVFIFEETVVLGAPEPVLGDYFDAGCATGANLRAMAEGRATTISCDHMAFTEQGLLP